MPLVEATPPKVLLTSVMEAVSALRVPNAKIEFERDSSGLIRDLQHPTMDEAISVRALLRHVANKFGAHDKRDMLRGPDGRPRPPFNARFQIHGYTDCVGEDPETQARIRVTEAHIMEDLGESGPLKWEKTNPFCPQHTRATIRSAYFTHLQRQRDNEAYQDYLVLLANTALRIGDNPNAQGCPFVLAPLKGRAMVLTTFNGPGIELQTVKPYVEELWHTTLGVEKDGNGGGKKPSHSFRSKWLLPFFENVVNGNAGVEFLDAEMDRELIEDCKDIEIDSRDEFGNLKLNILFREVEKIFPFGTRVKVSVGFIEGEAIIGRSHGDGHGEELVIAPGTSPGQPYDEDITTADIIGVNGRDASIRFKNAQESKEQRRIWGGRKVAIWNDSKRVEFAV